MTTCIAFLRGINVGGKHMIPMEKLRALCESIGLRDVKTHLQSGNVLFRTALKDPARAGVKMSDAVEKEFGFRVDVMIRTAEELLHVVDGTPLRPAGRDPSRLAVVFLHEPPKKNAITELAVFKAPDEELRAQGREVFAYFPGGMGTSKLANKLMSKGFSGTARNWNTVTRMLALARELEG